MHDIHSSQHIVNIPMLYIYVCILSAQCYLLDKHIN